MKFTKRVFAMLIAVLMLLSMFAVAVFAEGEETKKEYECPVCLQRSSNVVADYSCKEGLKRNYVIIYCDTCKTGVHVYLDARAKHDPEPVKGTPSTCTQKGLSDGSVCKVCGQVIEEQKTLNLADHEWDENNYCKNCHADKLSDRCPYCNQQHEDNFGGRISRFFHNIAYFFQNMFNR